MEKIFKLWDNEEKKPVEVKAKQTGDHLWKALCPFHKDTNPSLMIDDQRHEWGTYHCLGCERKGLLYNEEYAQKVAGVTAVSVATPSLTGDFMTGGNWKMRFNGRPTIEWLWDGIIPTRGVSVILGKPKLGKSTFALNLADSITYGKPFLGRNVKQGKVIYMVLEGESLIDQTVDKWELNENFIWWNTPLDDNKKVEVLKGWVKEHKPVAVFIDNLQRFFKVKKIEDYSELSLALQPIEDIARMGDTHIITTHHSKKNVEGDIRDSFLGSTAGMGSVETAMFIQGYPVNAHPFKYRTFSTIQRCHKAGEDDSEGIVLNIDSEYRLSCGGAKEDRDTELEGKEIIDLLQAGKMEQLKIEQAVGRKVKAIRLLWDLEKRGLIHKEGKGVKGDPYVWGL